MYRGRVEHEELPVDENQIIDECAKQVRGRVARFQRGVPWSGRHSRQIGLISDTCKAGVLQVFSEDG